ncbi:hypothetical protein [Kribbella deserti]|uniref:Uncharacterized protein n=1 Tax=Kribbella deserti TaxID=1926257 RepID=A0ABV6QN91_9ACTN
MKRLAIVAALVGALAGCGAQEDPPPAPAAPVTSATAPTVTFFAEGDGTDSGSLTMITESGGTLQKDVGLPLRNGSTGEQGVTSHAFRSGATLYLSVQNSNGYGAVTCRIAVNGVEIDKVTSSGGYKIATCRGRVP